MKRLLVILILIFWVHKCFSQWTQYPIPQNLGRSPSTLVYTNSIKADQGIIFGSFADTAAANALPYLRYNVGTAIWSTGDSSLYVLQKSAFGSYWFKVAGAGGGATGQFYNLTGNYLAITPANLGVGFNDPYNVLNFRTNNTTRLTIPIGGIVRSSAAINKYLMMDTSTKEMYYGDGGAGSSYTLQADSLKNWALQFNLLKAHNVNHGYFWPLGDSLLRFYNEAWVIPEVYSGGGYTGYYISAGYGGVHFLLLGVTATTTSFTMTGNVWDGIGTLADYTFSSYDTIPINTLRHIAVGYDSSSIVIFIDGVPCGVKTFAKWRKAASVQDAYWFTGGSTHNNFHGKILRIRHIEEDIPAQLGIYKIPKWNFDGNAANVVLNVDYTEPTEVIDDKSPGFWGRQHPGVRSSYDPSQGGSFSNIENTVNPAVDARQDSTLPQWVRTVFEKPEYNGPATSIPGGAVVYDDFRRTDITPAWVLNPVLDTTEGGSAGRLPYTTRYSTSGIIADNAWFDTGNAANENYATVDCGQTNQDIRVTAEGNNIATNRAIRIEGRWTDHDNRVDLYAYNGTTYLTKYIAGTPTSLGSFATGTFTTLRLVISGSTCDVYEDATIKITGADISGVTSSTKCGFGAVSNYARIESWVVY